MHPYQLPSPNTDTEKAKMIPLVLNEAIDWRIVL